MHDHLELPKSSAYTESILFLSNMKECLLGSKNCKESQISYRNSSTNYKYK